MVRSRVLLLACVLCSFAWAQVYALEYYVDSVNGVDSPSCIGSAPTTSCLSIKYAIASLSDVAVTVNLAAGVYCGNNNTQFEIGIRNFQLKGSSVGGTIIECMGGYGYYVNSKTAKFTMSNVEMRNCSGSNGAALYFQNVRTPITISSSKFTNNYASGSGGAIYVQQGQNVIISDSIFTNNNATNDGGALVVLSSQFVSVSNTAFKGNYAADTGGAIYTSAVEGNVQFSSVVFDNNSAYAQGGALFVNTDNNPSLDTVVSFDNNTAFYNNCVALLKTDPVLTQFVCQGGACDSGKVYNITGCTTTISDTNTPGATTGTGRDEEGENIDEDDDSSMLSMNIVIIIIVVVSVLLFVGSGVVYYIKRKRSQERRKYEDDAEAYKLAMLRRFSQVQTEGSHDDETDPHKLAILRKFSEVRPGEDVDLSSIRVATLHSPAK